jgi:hypothetical protein
MLCSFDYNFFSNIEHFPDRLSLAYRAVFRSPCTVFNFFSLSVCSLSKSACLLSRSSIFTLLFYKFSLSYLVRVCSSFSLLSHNLYLSLVFSNSCSISSFYLLITFNFFSCVSSMVRTRESYPVPTTFGLGLTKLYILDPSDELLLRSLRSGDSSPVGFGEDYAITGGSG